MLQLQFQQTQIQMLQIKYFLWDHLMRGWATLFQKFLITTYNNDGSNSLDMQVQFSEDNSTWFAESGYAGSVTLAAGAFDAYASSIEHHFYRVVINSTSSGNSADFEIFYNFVKDKGDSGL